MTREENIKAILDTCFSESKDEIKEIALKNIMSLSDDEYVPNKACFDCMERGTRMCKGTIQEQSWCPIVAKTDDLVHRKTLIGAIQKCGEDKIYPDALIETIKSLPSEKLSGDLISRQDAIEAVANAIWHYPNEQYKNLNDYDMAEALAKDALSALPSTDKQKYETFCGVPIEEAYKVMRGYSLGEYTEIVHCQYCQYHGMSDCPMLEGAITEDYMWCCFGTRKSNEY